MSNSEALFAIMVGVLLFAFLFWASAAIVVVAWNWAASDILIGLVKAELMPAEITWVQGLQLLFLGSAVAAGIAGFVSRNK